MAYQDYQVRITFTEDESGAVPYIFTYVDHVSDPIPSAKDTVIHGTRGDGCIRIKGGKRSNEIIIKGKLIDEDGYKDLTTKIAEMRSKVTTNQAILTMEHYDGGWQTDWSYTCFRNEEIKFAKSLRTESQDYEVTFLILAF